MTTEADIADIAETVAVEAELQAVASTMLAWLDPCFACEDKRLLPTGMFATLAKHGTVWTLSLFHAVQPPNAADIDLHAQAFGAPVGVVGRYSDNGPRVTLQREVTE